MSCQRGSSQQPCHSCIGRCVGRNLWLRICLSFSLERNRRFDEVKRTKSSRPTSLVPTHRAGAVSEPVEPSPPCRPWPARPTRSGVGVPGFVGLLLRLYLHRGQGSAISYTGRNTTAMSCRRGLVWWRASVAASYFNVALTKCEVGFLTCPGIRIVVFFRHAQNASSMSSSKKSSLAI